MTWRRGRVSGHAAAFTAALGCLCLAPPALAQRLGEVRDVEVPWWRLVGALLICLCLGVGAIYAMRARLTGRGLPQGVRLWPPRLDSAAKLLGARERRLRLVEALRLSHQMDVCLIACDDMEFTIAATPHGGFLISAKAAPVGGSTGE